LTAVSRETEGGAVDADRANACALVPEIVRFLEPLKTFVRLLERWRKITNLIADSTFNSVWTRHIADSAQLVTLAEPYIADASGEFDKRRWLDLGSGAGFPGLIVAILLREVQDVEVHCVEADKRKCAFLREAARACEAPVVVHPVRLETLSGAAIRNVKIISARALSPLPRLLDQAKPWLEAGAVGLFPRGASDRDFKLDAEVARSYEIISRSSRIDTDGSIIIIKSLKENGNVKAG
jgi:16S rRNA (guanine527-N7)-methyltransferase